MARIRRHILGLALALTAAPAFAAPLEAYGKLPSIEDVAISPDGARLAMIATDGEKRSVAIEDLASHKLEANLQAGDAKLRAILWVGPNHLAVIRSVTSGIRLGDSFVIGVRGEHVMGFDYNLTTRRAHGLMSNTPSASNFFSSPRVRTANGEPALFVDAAFFRESRSEDSVYRLDPETGRGQLVEEGRPQTAEFVLDASGDAVAEAAFNDRDDSWSLRFKDGAGWREVRREIAPIDMPSLRGLGRDGRSILVSEVLEGQPIVREVTPAGVWSAPLPVHDDSGLIFDPVKHNLIGSVSLQGDARAYEFFDARDQQAWAAVEHAFAGQSVELASWSDDRRKIVVLADSPTDGPGYALVDLDAGKASWIANQYDQIGPNDISPRKPVSFKAADGLALTGYLTTPRGRDPKALPLIVFPHGGPAARDEPGFDWWAQAMASRGYAVLQVNYRGSNGFGQPFLEAGYGQWGRKMQTDLSDGVRWLAAQGVIDPKRVCIVGASYGGYAALAGATLDLGVYRCAVSYAGPADLRAMVGWSGDYEGMQARRYWLRYMGAKDAGDPALAAISPAAHVDALNIPLLLIHGKDDTVVPLAQSRIMANDARAAGKRVDLEVLDSTDHWLTRGATRLQMLRAAMAFVEKNNPPN